MDAFVAHEPPCKIAKRFGNWYVINASENQILRNIVCPWWANKTSRDLSFRCVSGGYRILQKPHWLLSQSASGFLWRIILFCKLLGWKIKLTPCWCFCIENCWAKEWLKWTRYVLQYADTIPWICYERSFSELYLFIWNQLVFNQRLQLFVQSRQPYLLIFAWIN